MIFDKLENFKIYNFLSSKFNIGFEYLISKNLDNLEIGTHIIEREDIFCNIEEYSTQNIETKFYESHKYYADIQYIVQGIDYMGYKDTTEATIKTDYNKNRDIIFYKDKINGNLLKVPKGFFCVFFPNEGHVSGIANTEVTFVKKAVIKIKMD